MRKIIHYSKKSSKDWRLYRLGGVLVLLLVIFSGIYSLKANPTLKFFYMMYRVPAWTTIYDENPLSSQNLMYELHNVACFLREQSEEDRRQIVVAYSNVYPPGRGGVGYIWKNTGLLPLDNVLDEYALWRLNNANVNTAKLYLLWRVLFDVSEEYPKEDARDFAVWSTSRPRDKETFNLLWPFGYQNKQLVLKAGPGDYRGSIYDSLAEYDYLAARFPLRDLSCAVNENNR